MVRENHFGIGEAYGKLFLAGEYAVLENHPAIILHVPLKLTTCIRPSTQLVVNTTFPFADSSERQKGIGLIQQLLTYLNKLFHQKSSYSVEIVSELFNKQGKLGLGSSGALIISIVKAFLLLYRIQVDATMIFKIAAVFACEHHIKGSYADLAAAINPYHIVYQKPTNLDDFCHQDWEYLQTYPLQGLVMKKIDIQTPISITAIHSQIITSSDQGITSFYQLSREIINNFNQRSHILVQRLITSLSKNVSCETIEILQEISNLLRGLAQEMSVSVVPFANCKSSGAFGGDFFLVFCPSTHREFQFEVKV